jgi:hypothetical protein
MPLYLGVPVAADASPRMVTAGPIWQRRSASCCFDSTVPGLSALAAARASLDPGRAASPQSYGFQHKPCKIEYDLWDAVALYRLKSAKLPAQSHLRVTAVDSLITGYLITDNHPPNRYIGFTYPPQS